MTKPTIGFIGLGVMGKPMARNLLKAGYPLVVHNRSREPVEELAGAGAKPAFSPAEVASRSQVTITMLPDSPDVELVALGESGLIEGVSEEDVYVDMSTIAPPVAVKVANAMAEKGVRCLDAPVSGGDVGAINASLSIMVGGDEDLFNEMVPIFEVMGKTITLCGPNGAGQTVKACNQIQPEHHPENGHRLWRAAARDQPGTRAIRGDVGCGTGRPGPFGRFHRAGGPGKGTGANLALTPNRGPGLNYFANSC